MTTVTFKELSERHSAEHYDYVSVTPTDGSNEEETVWERVSDGTSIPPDKLMPMIRPLHVIAIKSDNVRERLEELGYSTEGFVIN